MTFQELGLCPEILAALRKLGYTKPTPIQEKAIPPALAGRDVLGCAQTGTGKTCAFAAPILQRLNARPVKGRPIRALILTPTRELALQIQESFELYGKNLPLRSAVIFGGVGQQPQVDKLKAGVDILVATPGRLEDLHNQGFIHVENLEIFVLDEADRMLDMGFIHDVKKILTWLPKKKQTLFFSATMPPEVQGLVDSLLHDPVKVAVDPVSSPVEIIDQRLFYVDRSNKPKLLAMLVAHPDVKNALVFTRTKHGANKVAGELVKAGISAAAIHGNKSQTARQQALGDFKAGRIKALVATDIAARGLDIEELSHVFNYNLPDVPETYVHRIGRTGRAGRGGTAVSFCEFGEKELLAPIEKLLKKPIPVVDGHPFPMQSFEAPKRDKHGKLVNADDDEARQAARERKKLRDAALPQKQPKQEQKKPAPQAEPKKAAPQTTAAGKRLSPGYKPSRTLEEAITAMAPKSQKQERRVPAPKDSAGKPQPSASRTDSFTPKALQTDDEKRAAFERWMAEERAIQAKKGYADPLAGEEVMDATARLLAPKKPAGRTPPPRDTRRDPLGRTKAPKSQPKAGQQKPQPKAVKPKEAPKAQKQESKPAQAPAKSKAKLSLPFAPKKQAKAAPPVKEAPRRENRSRKGPREVTLRPGGQKDSTEQQGSLMKPYYFNPNEE